MLSTLVKEKKEGKDRMRVSVISVAETSARLRHLVAGEVNLCKSDLLGPLLRY
jgi:hypothetical protein